MIPNLIHPASCLYARLHPILPETCTGPPPYLHIILQDNDQKEDLEGESEEDPSESDPELEIDIDPESDSNSVPPSSSLPFYLPFYLLPLTAPPDVVAVQMEARAGKIGTTIMWDPRLWCNGIVSSVYPPPHNIPFLLPPPHIIDQSNILWSYPLLPLVTTPSPSSSPNLPPHIPLRDEDDKNSIKGFLYSSEDHRKDKYKYDHQDKDRSLLPRLCLCLPNCFH